MEGVTLDQQTEEEHAARAEAVLQILCEGELRLATAESCTGGLVAALLTDIEGCSHAFERGFVTYSDAAKQELLDVPAEMLETHGAVSEPVAVAMAEGALRRSEAHLAVSVTGFAGPGGPGDEEGLVHFALAREGRNTVHRVQSFGALGRDAIRQRSLGTILEMLEETVA